MYHVVLRGKQAPVTPAAKTSQIGGRYLIGDEIGAGGFATVHIGRELAHGRGAPGSTGGAGSRGHAASATVGTGGRMVAIKRLHPPLAREPEVAATLLDEGRIVARIKDPNVVQLFDIIVEDGDIFLVFEYVAGESLSALMRFVRAAGARIPIDVACAIARDVLRGLHAAHEATDERQRPLGVVHRDVSPHNIQVGADGHTRVLDFGVAKAAGQSHTTRPGQIKGKLSYMSPEQLRGGFVTRRSDIYAASIVIWEMLTLERPFGDPKDTDAMLASLSIRPLAPSTFVSGIPRELDALILRGLTLDPRGRYATAEEMARDLERSHAVAPPARVAAWVRKVAGPSLAMRAALLEKAGGPPARTSRVWGRVIGAVLVALVVGVLLALRFRHWTR